MSFMDYLSRQARHPSGWFGRIGASRVFDKGNAAINEHMVELVAPCDGQRILEIGFGTGQSIAGMASGVQQGLIEGVDISDAMMGIATKRNRAAIASGKVQLHLGSFETLERPALSYDTICSANTLYFWTDPKETLTSIVRLLKPQGKVVLGFVGKKRMDELPLSKDVFQSYSPEDVMTLCREGGCRTAELSLVPGHKPEEYCVVAIK